MISTRVNLLVVAAMLAAAGPALAAPLVVRASGPSVAAFKPGQRLPEAAPLVLRAGDKVTILDARGTRDFVGPGSFNLAAASAAATPTAYADLLTQKPQRRARIGAVRGSAGAADAKRVPPGIWALDTGSSGTVCALDPTQISLWRANPADAARLTITRVGDNQAATVPFGAGEAVARWPATLAARSGDRVRIAGGPAPQNLELRTLPAAPAAIDDLGAALLEQGCTSQFDRLVAITRAAP